MIKEYLEKISQNKDLTRQEAAEALQMLIDDQLTATEIGALLFGLRTKGESVEEILGFVDTMQANMVAVAIDDPDAIDVCGTGGDQSHSFNVSTTAAFVVAAGGVTVAKHGNRSVSSKAGSADVLEKLGARIDLSPENTRKCLNEIGIGFFFAPMYHPAMKAVAPHRKNLGIRTIFNMLGPLINPANLKRQLIGVYNLETATKMAAVLRQRSYKKACVVHSEEGFDEVSPFAGNRVFEVDIARPDISEYVYQVEKCPKKLNSYQLVRGGDAEKNARITLEILNGRQGYPREMTALNAAFGLYVADKVGNIPDGVALAEELIDSGKALKKLNQFIEMSSKLAN
ncbi:MAG TPA: anthranilate phosphoribosyltransferase [Candidatus Marinimicrobia bacterium]|nr:anthranilate phosphoribosyltransferase [Candidatus Neomarinimicrobiota bacterium]HRS50950.1 anthranilate phosphoribosyltransferase [Candidatus Neomarinimicrobiota bacterium]HRU91708.1 anthranilate phosphoribosyltransferase [Candidatus Neomarinimicrobiota bacterium]